MIALIPARGGSKGLPRKNVLPLHGKPLIAWTIEAALQSSCISEVYVTTDDDEIRSVSEKYGAKCIVRPSYLASDTANSESVIVHAINYLNKESASIGEITLLQPTSPLRTSKHIDEAILEFRTKNASLVISVFEPAHTPIKAYILKSTGELIGLFSESAPYSRRQDLPIAFQPNGAIYVFACDVFMEKESFPLTNVFPYIMNEQDSGDVDTLKDLLQIERLIKESK